MVGRLRFGDQALVSSNYREGRGFFNRPFANIGEGLATYGGLLGGLGWRPSVSPVVCELFQERGFYFGRLEDGREINRSRGQMSWQAYCKRVSKGFRLV